MTDHCNRLHWALSQIIELCPGHGDVIYVAKLQTVSGTLTWPVKKLCLLKLSDEHLPIDNNQECSNTLTICREHVVYPPNRLKLE